MRLLRLIHWKARSRYWRKRAQRAEASNADLLLQLEAERDRNREREDTFVSASIMGSRMMYGVPPRSGPAVPMKQVGPAPTPHPARTVWDTLSWADREEFDMCWKPGVEAAGASIREAQERFINEVVIPRRQPLNDEPYN